MIKKVLLLGFILTNAALPVLAQAQPALAQIIPVSAPGQPGVGKSQAGQMNAPPPDIDMTKTAPGQNAIKMTVTSRSSKPDGLFVASKNGVKDGVQGTFNERLLDLKLQVNSARDRGWLTSERATSLLREHDRLIQAVDDAELKGWQSNQISKLDKDITFFGAEVSSAMKVETAGKANIWR